MQTKKEKVGALLKQIAQWVANEDAIVAAALVGSYATNTAQETSDIDLLILAQKPMSYVTSTTWAQQFGTVIKTNLEYYGNVNAIRVWYENGLEVEYGFTDNRWVRLPIDPETARIVRDGMTIIYDPHNVFSALR